ncbi:MAG: gliding motility-associated-like protein [Bacteroidia bacterium]
MRIPKNPTTNTILRMRIMSDFDTIRNPCDSLRYGQTEDYGVVIERRIPKPYFVSDTNRICKGGQIVLTDSSEGSIYNQKWVVSKYGLLTYSSDSAGPITFTLPDTGWYYAQLYLNDSLVNYRIDSVVYVQPIPITTLSVSQGKLVSCEGDAIGLKASMDYPSTSTLNWFKNNVSISGAQDSLLNISPIAMLDSGYYKVVVNRNGCGFTSDSLKLSVRPKPVADFTINLYNQCFNTQDFVFTNASTISSGSNTYNWDFGNGSGSAMQDPSFIYSDTGSYNVRLIANGNGTCYDTAVQSVVVIQNPVAGFTVNNDVQCFKNHSFQLSNTSDAWATSWKWSFGNGTSSTQKHDTVLFGVEGLYTVELVAVSNQGCTDTMRSNLTLNASPTSDFIVSVIAPCLSNNEFDYTNTSSITTGSIAINTWDLGDGSSRATPSVNGHSYATAGSKNVRLIVQSNAGCADTSIQTANVLLSPTASFSINDSVQCLSGNSVVLDNSSSIPVGFGATYNWDFGDGSSTPAGAPLPHTYATEGSYVVEFQVHSNNSCSDTLQKTMVIDPSPIVDFTGGVGCVGTQIDFVNNTLIAFGTLDKFAWDFGDGATSILTAPSHIYAKPGVYEVKLVVESNKGCKDSSIYKSAAEIFANPTADYTYAKTASFGTTTELSFTDVSIGASVWFWQFGSQENSTDPNPIISFTDTGTIAVQLAVSSAEGCVDTITKYIFVFPESTFYIPNSFSPNGDEINDRLNAVGVLFVQEFKLQVFNRWGEQMFETTKAQEGWDGTYKGELASAGFYIVVIEYKDFNNNLVRQNMRVYLMR